ncbi:MAG: WbqC family protein [Myxococcota bacterium]|nr:WbqC family protein [Myxococcota bacterium]
MRLGFMQPYFFPYPGYFALIAASDTWLVFDDAQMIRHGWVDRNRILHPEEGWQYIKVPTRKHRRGSPIRAVEASADRDWRARLLRQLGHYRKAPHHDEVYAWLETTLAGAPDNLALLTESTLSATCARLGIPFTPIRHSSLDYDRGAVNGPGDWALEAARHLRATAYVNPVGGEALFEPTRFAAAGCRLEVLEWTPTPYRQGRRPFEPGLSILDMMMHCSVDEIRSRIARARIRSAETSP